MPRAHSADTGILVSYICHTYVNSVSCSWAVFDVPVAARAALGVVPVHSLVRTGSHGR